MAIAQWDEKQWLQSGALLQRGKDTYTIGQGLFKNETIRGFQADKSGPKWVIPQSFFSDMNHSVGSYPWNATFEKSPLLNATQSHSIPQVLWEEPNYESFRHQFERIRSAITSGDITKAVAYCFEKAKGSFGVEELKALLHRILGQDDLQGYAFGYWDLQNEEGCIGLTPELLFESDQEQNITTMALAGTARDQAHDLMADPKERREHQLVVDQIQSQLEEFGSVSLGETRVWQPSQLSHLRTDIQAKVSGVSALSVLNALHPTPALGGAPPESADKILRQLDAEQPRMQFGAPFGVVLEDESSQFVVQIRCLIWRRGELFLGSGCGIVQESQIEQEWQELKRKRSSVKSILGV